VAPATGNSARPSAAGWRLLLQFGLYTVLICLFLSIAIMPWLTLSWWKVFRRCASIAAALSLWLVIRRSEGRSIGSYGFANRRAGKSQLALGLVVGVGTLALLLAVGLLVGACRIQVTPNTGRLWNTVIGFVPAALLIGVLEELVFRGMILQNLLKSSTPFAVIASSVLYAVVHVRTTVFGADIVFELIGLFLLGSVLALSYLATGQLYLAVGLHASLAYGARVNKLFLEFPRAMPTWVVGTNRIVNGLVAWLVLGAIAGLMVWWMRRSRTGGMQNG